MKLTTHLIVANLGTGGGIRPSAICAIAGKIGCCVRIVQSRAWCAKTIAVTYIGEPATIANLSLRIAGYRPCRYLLVAVVTRPFT